MTATITPWDVPAIELDYKRITEQFGCQTISPGLIAHLERVTCGRACHLIARGIVFAHRDFDHILDGHEQRQPFYLYTGRGPSTRSMHLGHAVPFLLCKYLQDAFDVPCVIQLTDDEKYLVRDMQIGESTAFARSNVRDIIAFGLNPDKTFIFCNTDVYDRENAAVALDNAFDGFFKKELVLAKSITFHEAAKVFGFDHNTNIGKIGFPVRQLLPCFHSSFSFLKRSRCLVPAAIDQDPYFRLARDKARVLGCPKPCTIYSQFLPALSNVGKMSSSRDRTIFLDDSCADIAKKIFTHAHSGGRKTLREHRERGGDLRRDTAFQYLRFFMEDEDRLCSIGEAYTKGEMLSTEMKRVCADEIQRFVMAYTQRRDAVCDDDVLRFMSCNKPFY